MQDVKCSVYIFHGTADKVIPYEFAQPDVKKGPRRGVFKGKLDNIETLCTDTHRSYTAFAKDKRLDHQKFNALNLTHIIHGYSIPKPT